MCKFTRNCSLQVSDGSLPPSCLPLPPALQHRWAPASPPATSPSLPAPGASWWPPSPSTTVSCDTPGDFTLLWARCPCIADMGMPGVPCGANLLAISVCPCLAQFFASLASLAGCSPPCPGPSWRRHRSAAEGRVRAPHPARGPAQQAQDLTGPGEWEVGRLRPVAGPASAHRFRLEWLLQAHMRVASCAGSQHAPYAAA